MTTSTLAGGRPAGRSLGARSLVAGAVLAAAAAAAAGGASSLVVTDATSLFFADDGAVYRINGPGDITTIASGAPLSSPSGILPRKPHRGEQDFLVADVGTFFGLDDGAILLVREGEATQVVYQGAPLSSPYGLLERKGHRLLIGDFGDPGSGADGAVYQLDLDPDGDGDEGPFPLPAAALEVIHAGPPLGGVNQIVWLAREKSLLVADDSGSLYVLDLVNGAAPAAFGPPFVDPVGLARSGDGFAVADAGAQELYFVDETGATATLLLGGTPGDQFLGVAADKHGNIALANARDLFGAFADGEVATVGEGSVGVAFSGAPLVTPMGVAMARAPRSASSAIVP